MKNYFKNWNFVRVLRLALGIYSAGYSNKRMDICDFRWLIFINAIGCNTPTRKSNKNTEDISYDEVR
jgi:hypothetical protein